MKRLGYYKIRRSGGGLAIVLPKEWLDESGVKHGDILELFHDADTLYAKKKGWDNETE